MISEERILDDTQQKICEMIGHLRGFASIHPSVEEYVQADTELCFKMINVLEEMKPIKPKTKARRGKYNALERRCGACTQNLYSHWNYCPQCGRRVAWK